MRRWSWSGLRESRCARIWKERPCIHLCVRLVPSFQGLGGTLLAMGINWGCVNCRGAQPNHEFCLIVIAKLSRGLHYGNGRRNDKNINFTRSIWYIVCVLRTLRATWYMSYITKILNILRRVTPHAYKRWNKPKDRCIIPDWKKIFWNKERWSKPVQNEIFGRRWRDHRSVSLPAIESGSW